MPWWCQNWTAWVAGIAVGTLVGVTCAQPPPTTGEERLGHCRVLCEEHGGLRYVDFGIAFGDICRCWDEETP